MAKIREVTIREEKGTFDLFSNKKVKKEDYDFDGISSLHKLLNKEKARLIDCIKYKKPISIYSLAKTLERPFKAVTDDVNLLKRFGIIELIKERTKNRVRHRPVVVTDHLIIHLRI